MGACIKVDGRRATIEGGIQLSGAPLVAVDLRGGIAVVIAALTAKGESEVTQINLIERGHDDIVGKLQSLGADIKKVYVPEPTTLKQAN